jgi:prophage tail gpP-like protein
MTESSSFSRRVALTVAGHVFDRWSSAIVGGDMRDISGNFDVEYFDSGRAAAALNPDLDPRPPFQIIKPGMACTVALDGAVVLVGFIDEVNVQRKAGSLVAKFTGRDATGDLVDCAASPPSAANPHGKTEWRNLDLLALATDICAPFGIKVRADVDVGPAFPIIANCADEKAMMTLQKAARQRAILIVSDGVGGLLLTKGGVTRAPAALKVPGNVQDVDYTSNFTERFSDYYVVGQTETTLQREGQTCALSHDTDPTVEPVADPTDDATTDETSSTVMIGHSVDPQISRYRPTVASVATQSGSSSVQVQSDWMLRNARGNGEEANYTVLDWRAGPQNLLWLRNQVVRVTDAYSGIDNDMLIAAVKYQLTAQQAITTLRIAGRTAFDLISEPAEDD